MASPSAVKASTLSSLSKGSSFLPSWSVKGSLSGVCHVYYRRRKIGVNGARQAQHGGGESRVSRNLSQIHQDTAA